MNAAGRLGLYGAGLAVAFAGAFAVAAAVVPDGVVEEWTMNAQDHGHGGDPAPETAPAGLALAARGYALSPVDAPGAVGEPGELSFRILDPAGDPVTAFEVAHEKELHLIVVRTDGTGFRHVHPSLDAASGTWSIPWEWDAAGSYRVFADFVPAGEDRPGPLTLARLVDVAGAFAPEPLAASATAEVDGFALEVDGALVAGSASELVISVARDGAPVTTLQPYLGAFGHLVALREGDLAYLHVHASGDDPRPGETAGPAVSFVVEVPTPGRYLLYLDFQVDGQVRTAAFVLDATPGGTETGGTEHGADH